MLETCQIPLLMTKSCSLHIFQYCHILFALSPYLLYFFYCLLLFSRHYDSTDWWSNMRGRHMPTSCLSPFGPLFYQSVFICRAKQVNKMDDCIWVLFFFSFQSLEFPYQPLKVFPVKSIFGINLSNQKFAEWCNETKKEARSCFAPLIRVRKH